MLQEAQPTPDRNYNTLSDGTKGVLEEFRGEVYETHGMVNRKYNIMVNLFYHMMYELTLAIDPTDAGWEEEDEFIAIHNKIAELLNYQRPYPSED